MIDRTATIRLLHERAAYHEYFLLMLRLGVRDPS